MNLGSPPKMSEAAGTSRLRPARHASYAACGEGRWTLARQKASPPQPSIKVGQAEGA
ncbi:hypothetical protein [Paenibacillus dendritiformis]|uniref:hypothetical protein n=1 Tax=Paenibacillus dendritiformis TaxID=130049 RepID=UPI0015EC9670|nr:hypothetical protein [Paenibacillus dendritiformis]